MPKLAVSSKEHTLQEAQNGNGGNRPIRTWDRILPEARPTVGTGYLLRDSTWIIGGQLTRNKKWVDVNINKCSQGPYRAMYSAQGLVSTAFCVKEKFLLAARVRLYGTLYYNLGPCVRGDQGFWLCDIASLVMYWIDAPERIVTKSLCGAARLYSVYSWGKAITVWIQTHS
jgi:hypothetical protein